MLVFVSNLMKDEKQLLLAYAKKKVEKGAYVLIERRIC